MNILLCKNWVANQESSVQIFVVHIYCGNLVIFVGCVVVDSFSGVAAGGVDGDFIFSFCYFAAASLLVHGAENVEELADAFGFGFAGVGVHFGEGYFGEAGGGGEVSWQAEGTHAAAVGLEVQAWGEGVLWLAWGESLVVV